MPRYRLYLTAEEPQTLEGWQKKYKSQSPKLHRIQILLNSDEHMGRRPAPELAAVLGCSTSFAKKACACLRLSCVNHAQTRR